MFGYVRPQKSELRVREYEAYRAVYCSLCRQLGKSYGMFARMTLSYDCTFFALWLMALHKKCLGFREGRCVVNPLKKCGACIGGGDELDVYKRQRLHIRRRDGLHMMGTSTIMKTDNM